PGQWKAGGERYPWDNWVAPRCHHPLRMGDRLYVSYWHHGLFILDISDMARPKPVAHCASSAAFPHPTHACLPIPQPLKGCRVLDIAHPFAPREVGHFLPDAPAGEQRVSSNDVTIDDRGLIYLIDRVRGLDIIEATALS